MTSNGNKVFAVWAVEQDGYGESLLTFASVEGVIGYVREQLEHDVATHTDRRREEYRAVAEKVLDEARAALQGVVAEWDFRGNYDHDGYFQGTRFMVRLCEVR